MEFLRTFIDGFRLVKGVVFDGKHPEETSLKMTLSYLRAIGIWPSKPSEDSYIYITANTVLMLSLISFVVTITCDLYEASSNFITFGDDLCVLVGLYLILLKIILYRIYKPYIIQISDGCESLHRKFMNCSSTIRKIQRARYIEEVLIFFTYIMIGNLLFAAVGFQPLISGELKTLPFRAKFPFSIDNKIVFIGAYMFQCICTFFNIKSILYIDNFGCVLINQISVNLKVLCQRIRDFSEKGITQEDLGEIISDHQKIIRLIELTNKYFYWNYVAQMGASTFLICLTAFEAQLAEDQPLVAIKFQTYMFSSFMQLFYWCWVGNKVRFDSLEVATAAYECDWVSQTPGFRRDLMFVIQRAQKPLCFRAKPFYGYDFESFANILSTSYSYFTLLRTLND